MNKRQFRKSKLEKGGKTHRFFRIEGLDFCAEEMGDKSEIARLLVEDGDQVVGDHIPIRSWASRLHWSESKSKASTNDAFTTGDYDIMTR